MEFSRNFSHGGDINPSFYFRRLVLATKAQLNLKKVARLVVLSSFRGAELSMQTEDED